MDSSYSVRNARRSAAERLRQHSGSAQIDADCLLCHVLGKSRSWLYTYAETPLTEQQLFQFESLIQRRKLGEPVAYLTGTQEFWSLSFKVSPDVLVPRVATECLIEECLNILSKNTPCRILELGTGSGAISVALAHERPHARIIATDIDPRALAIAKFNALQHHTNNQIEFIESDWFHHVPLSQYDVIVSNPPYIEQGDPDLAADVLQYEPHLALISPANGLAAIKVITDKASQYLKPGGYLLLEHGWKQHRATSQFCLEAGLESIRAIKDLAQAERATIARKPQ